MLLVKTETRWWEYCIISQGKIYNKIILLCPRCDKNFCFFVRLYESQSLRIEWNLREWPIATLIFPPCPAQNGFRWKSENSKQSIPILILSIHNPIQACRRVRRHRSQTSKVWIFGLFFCPWWVGDHPEHPEHPDHPEQDPDQGHDQDQKTKSQLMVTIQSGRVTKILALHRMTKFDFQPHFQKALMHSFSMMHYTMGSKVEGLARRGYFLPKKILFRQRWIWISWLQGSLGPKILKNLANFNIFQENSCCCSKSKVVMSQASWGQ